MRICFIFFLMLPGLLVGQKMREFFVEPDTLGMNVSYGSVIKLRFFERKNEEKKEISFAQFNRLVDIELNTRECKIDKEGIVFFRETSNKNLVSAKVTFKSKVSTVSVTPVIEVKMNFRGNISLIYDGYSGSFGNNGKHGGSGFFNKCEDCFGTNGNNGGSGGNGKNVAIHIRKEFDSLLNKSVYFFYITDQNSGDKSIYRCLDFSNGVFISSKGGDGADGGSGGDGLKGDDGDPPGDGADGGNGANGGDGGNGGIVTVIVHPNAKAIIDYLKIDVNAGKRGEGGPGGSGGTGGYSTMVNNHRYSGKSGIDGKNGSPGKNGVTGKYYCMVEDF